MFDPSKLSEMMAQAKEMQDRLQENLKTQLVEGQAGGGMVKVQVNGLYEVTRVQIDKAAVDPADLSMLEDLVTAAFNQALAKVESARADNARQMASSMGIPPGMF